MTHGSWLMSLSLEPLSLSVCKEMLVDELVDCGLIGRIDLLELQAHSDAPVAPRDARVRLHVHLRAGQAESDAHLGVLLQGTHRPDADSALAQVQRQRG